MAREDGAGAQVALTAMVTAALFSPRVRGLLRQGAVHGLAGVLVAGDALVAFARGVSAGIHDVSAARNHDQPTEGPRTEPGPYPANLTNASPVPETVSEPSVGSSAPGSRTRHRKAGKQAGTAVGHHANSPTADSVTESSNA